MSVGWVPAHAFVLPASESRVMVIVAHPDDETTGAAARLPLFRDVRVVYLTDGAPRRGGDAEAAGCASAHDYAALRRRELEAAMAIAGWSSAELIALGYPDQGASLAMVEAAQRVGELVTMWRPDVLLTQPYEGGHPDHDATAFAVHAAAALLRRRSLPTPPIVEMASYHDGDSDGVTTFQDFLPCASAPTVTVELDASARSQKRRMLDAHASQARTLASFRDDVERYRAAPRYDFMRAPHPGRLNYERFDWGMNGEQWRACARAALHALDLAEAAWR